MRRAILIALLILAGCGSDAGGEWYDYAWTDTRARPRLQDWPGLSRDCLLGPDFLMGPDQIGGRRDYPIVSRPGCVQRFDYDHDGDVDLRDVAMWQRVLSGEQYHPIPVTLRSGPVAVKTRPGVPSDWPGL